MRTPVLILAAIPVLAAAGGVITLVTLANRSVATAEERIKDTNSAVAPLGLQFAYDRIEQAGSLFAPAIKVVNPRFTFDNSSMVAAESERLKNMPPAYRDNPLFTPHSPLIFHTTSTGNILLTADYLRHSYRMEFKGTTQFTFETQGQKISGQTSLAQQTATLTMDAASHFLALQWGGMKALAPMLSEAEQKNLTFVESITYQQSAMEISTIPENAATPAEKIITDEGASFAWHNRPADNGNATGTIALELKGQTIFPALDRILQTLYPNNGSFGMMAGKTKAAFVASYDLPRRAMANTSPTMKLDVSRCEIQTNELTFACPFSVYRHSNGNGLKADWQFNLTSSLAAMVEKSFALGLESAAQPLFKGKTPSQVTQLQKNAAQQLHAWLPNLSTLGPIQLKVDLSAKQPSPAQPDAQFNIQQFSVGHGRWGVASRGSVSKKAGANAIHLALDCRHCSTLAWDAATLVNQTKALATTLNPKMAQDIPPISANHYQAIVTLLETLGRKDAATDTLRFTFTTGENQTILLNGRPLQEALTAGLMLLNAPPTSSAQGREPMPPLH